MTLKELLAEVEKAKETRERAPMTLEQTFARYKQVLMPDLAQRLEKAEKSLQALVIAYAIRFGRTDCDVQEYQEARKTLNEINEPPTLRERIRETPGRTKQYELVAQSLTRLCPNCSGFMIWAKDSDGWYCAEDIIFIPANC